MLIDMTVVLLGVIMLTVSNGSTEQGWVVMYGISQLVFGIGIGGEYPATSTRCEPLIDISDEEYSWRTKK